METLKAQDTTMIDHRMLERCMSMTRLDYDRINDRMETLKAQDMTMSLILG